MKTGVIFIEGKPGSGKSFKGTQELIREIVRNKRPVYSNLPLRDRPLKRYLTRRAGRDAYYKLWQPLTEEHFHRFTERAVRMDKIFSQWKHELREKGVKRSKRAEFDEWYAEHHPEDPAITSGPDANWIPEGAVLILDEVHLWTPQTGTQKNKDLLGYASMHRHHHHLVYLLTQDAMQASKEWRDQAIQYIRVDDASSIPILGPVSFATLGLRNKLARYAYYSPENYAQSKATGRKQGKADRVEICVLPFYPHIFHCYDSFGRTGVNQKDLRKQLAARAAEAGLEAPPYKQARRRKFRLRTWFFRGVKLMLLVMGSSLVFIAGRASVALTTAPPAEPSGTDQAAPEKTQRTLPAMRLEYLADSWARIDGRAVEVGASYDADHLLWYINRADGYAVLVPRDTTGDPAWLLVPGRAAESLGPADRFLARIRDELGGRTADVGPDAAAAARGPDPAGP